MHASRAKFVKSTRSASPEEGSDRHQRLAKDGWWGGPESSDGGNGTLEQMESHLLRITVSISLPQLLRRAFSPVPWSVDSRTTLQTRSSSEGPVNLRDRHRPSFSTLLIPASSNALSDETERDPTGGPFATFESDPTVPTTLVRTLQVVELYNIEPWASEHPHPTHRLSFYFLWGKTMMRSPRRDRPVSKTRELGQRTFGSRTS